jgi:hypothetical protein
MNTLWNVNKHVFRRVFSGYFQKVVEFFLIRGGGNGQFILMITAYDPKLIKNFTDRII